MTGDEFPLVDEEDLEEIIDDIPSLIEIRKLTARASRLNWFGSVGEPVDPALNTLCQSYLDKLGFPDTPISPVDRWSDAAGLAENPDFDSLAWNAEEQLRATLLETALERTNEEALSVALRHLSNTIKPVITESLENAAALGDVSDAELLVAATGAAVQACHMMALAVLGGIEVDHPFFDKFEIFARGRWPIGITGATFNLF